MVCFIGPEKPQWGEVNEVLLLLLLLLLLLYVARGSGGGEGVCYIKNCTQMRQGL